MSRMPARAAQPSRTSADAFDPQDRKDKAEAKPPAKPDTPKPAPPPAS